jgi:hypothetical protein
MSWKLYIIVEDSLETFLFDTEDEATVYKDARLDLDSIQTIIKEEA